MPEKITTQQPRDEPGMQTTAKDSQPQNILDYKGNDVPSGRTGIDWEKISFALTALIGLGFGLDLIRVGFRYFNVNELGAYPKLMILDGTSIMSGALLVGFSCWWLVRYIRSFRNPHKRQRRRGGGDY